MTENKVSATCHIHMTVTRTAWLHLYDKYFPYSMPVNTRRGPYLRCQRLFMRGFQFQSSLWLRLSRAEDLLADTKACRRAREKSLVQAWTIPYNHFIVLTQACSWCRCSKSEGVQ